MKNIIYHSTFLAKKKKIKREKKKEEHPHKQTPYTHAYIRGYSIIDCSCRYNSGYGLRGFKLGTRE